jgi:single-strand DNA-binding protein
MWDKTAKICGDYVRKGGLIGAQGQLKFETWSDRATGLDRSKPIIEVERLELLGSKPVAEMAA